jgi:hypothetical protein
MAELAPDDTRFEQQVLNLRAGDRPFACATDRTMIADASERQRNPSDTSARQGRRSMLRIRKQWAFVRICPNRGIQPRVAPLLIR